MIYRHKIKKEALGHTLSIEELKVVNTELGDLVEIDNEIFKLTDLTFDAINNEDKFHVLYSKEMYSVNILRLLFEQFLNKVFSENIRTYEKLLNKAVLDYQNLRHLSLLQIK